VTSALDSGTESSDLTVPRDISSGFWTGEHTCEITKGRKKSRTKEGKKDGNKERERGGKEETN
jgi:hypothetical protein